MHRRMSKEIQEIVTKAEDRWLAALYRHCGELFSGVFLPSHDHLHHNRVWSHARSLLFMLSDKNMTLPESLPEQLLIACFFHDTGLLHSCGEQHGRESRRLCEEFFLHSVSGVQKPGDSSFQAILHAIEHHDDKSLRPSGPGSRRQITPGLLSLLSVSDDLDAFGRMGTYRYAEIYLLRGLRPEDLPLRVAENVKDRFMNLRSTFSYLGDFLLIQEKRFLLVYDFYLRLAQAYSSRNENPTWEPVLIEMIRDSLINRVNLLEAGRVLPAGEFDKDIREWFNALDRENPGPYFT